MIEVFTQELPREWIDEYGHMSEIYYLAAAGAAIWSLFDRIGIGVGYLEATGCGLYAVESHVRYLKEIRTPATLETSCIIAGVDQKRIHYGAVIRVNGIERSTAESVLIHVNTRTGKVASLPERALEQLRALEEKALPDWCGRSVSLRKR